MDSGNSGSLQSSSGADEEYDSRAAESVSAFMTNPPPPFFDPLSNYLHLHQNPNSSSSTLLNSVPAWPRIRPDPTHLNTSMMSPTSNPPFMPSFQAAPPPPPPPALAQNQNPTAARASKKRSRASRRAPTTVLTTDTTNFRAMVQEFTGIPAPPFNNSSFPRNRLDLFSTRSAAPPPPYLRRPFPQKPHSLISPAADASSSYHLPISQNSNLFNIPNPLLTSFLQSNPKFPFSNPPKMGGLDEQFNAANNNNNHNSISSSDNGLSGLPNLIHTHSNDQNDGNNNAARWNDSSVVRDGLPEDKDDGSYSFARNYHGGKAPENVGGVESWICSSE